MGAVDSAFGGVILLVLIGAMIAAALIRRRRQDRDKASFDGLTPRIYFEPGGAIRTSAAPAPSRHRRAPNVIASANIAYCDAQGEVTRRTIDIFRISAVEDDVYVEAICRLRGDARTFRASRIEELIDLSTGEVVDDPEDYLINIPGARGRKKSFTDELRRIDVQILTFVGRSDGRLSKSERDTIASHLEAVAPDAGHISIPSKGPGIDEFKTAVRRGRRLPADRKAKLLVAIDTLVQSKKTQDPVLKALLELVREQLGSASSATPSGRASPSQQP